MSAMREARSAMRDAGSGFRGARYAKRVMRVREYANLHEGSRDTRARIREAARGMTGYGLKT